MNKVIVKTRRLEPENPKLTIIVGKSYSKKAVDRNRFKRRARSIFRQITKNNPEKAYTVIAKPEAKKMKFQEIKEEVLKQTQ